jgi:regulation of enolase protein 1 (concanavalin A-like superfamily)
MNWLLARYWGSGLRGILCLFSVVLITNAENYTNIDIGSVSSPGSTVVAGGEVRVTTSGVDIGGALDQCQFYYRTVDADFDVRVRVQSLDGGDLWAKAGIMARQSLESGSPSVAVVATPNLLGCLLVSRLSEQATAIARGGFPPAIPYLWLRLQRTNGVFSGYASVDGELWQAVSSVNYEAQGSMYLGLAASSHAANSVATAIFTGFSEVTNAIVSTTPIKQELPGPSTRRTGLAFTEIMYKPAAQADGKDLEFIELFNSNPFFEDISGYKLTGNIDYTFPEGTVLPGGGYLVVAKVPGDIKARYGLATVLGPYDKRLASDGTIRLRNVAGAVLLEVTYSKSAPWPLAAAGAGHSLVLSRPSYGEDNVEAWDASFSKGGSPGFADPPRVGAWNDVVLNEYQGSETGGGGIELFNRRNEPIDVSHAFLSDSSDTNKFQIPQGTIIPGRGYLVFTARQLGFSLGLGGATLFLSNPDQTQIVQATTFGAHAAGASLGCHPDGSDELYTLATPTLGANNSEIALAPVVINEIMYHPLSDDDDDQYVELFNPGSKSVDLGGWRFVSGVDFTFPAGAALPAGGYLVVARQAARLQTNYAHLNSGNLVGDFKGKLSHNGERLALARPLEVANPVSGEVTTRYEIVDEVTYRPGGRWGQWADGGGSSLELIDARADRRRASNWADSDETQKAPWTTVEKTGYLNYGYIAADSLHVMLLGRGECLVDEAQVLIEGVATNLLYNSTFEENADNWSVLGNHVRSTLETTEGYHSSHSFHVRASDHGDTSANRIRAKITSPSKITYGKEGALRAKVRWLCGSPDFLVRLKGNYLEAYSRLEVPKNLGTPGQANSRALSNAGPAIDGVTHFPAVPAADQPVVVMARVSDPDGLSAVKLRYRIDPATGYTEVPMLDDGANGDRTAGDGIYSATIPGQAAAKMAAFYVMASDRRSAPATTLFPNDAPTRECLVRFGDTVVASPFGTYRMWMTAATVTKWVARPVLSNEELDVTFVYGNQRVVYNASARFSGSPFHQGSYTSPIVGLCTYAMSVPGDDQVLGTTSFNKLHVPGNTPGDDSTIQCEQTAYWMVRQLGLPWNYQRYFHMYVNGVKRGNLMEDTQVPGPEVLAENFPDNDNGNLYKISGYMEYADAKSGSMTMQSQEWGTLNQHTTYDGQPDVAGYRWTWASRANRGFANDYTNVIALSAAACNYYTDTYQTGMDALVDMKQWLRTFAIEHIVGNWDSFGFNSGQNMYAYKPKDDRWRLIIWDFNIVLSNGSADKANNNDLFNYNGGDTGLYYLYNHLPYRRAYLREIQAIAQSSAMDSSKIDALVDARWAAFKAVGLPIPQPTSIKSYVSSRRAALLNMVARYDSNFKLTGNTATDFTTNLNWFTLTGEAPLTAETIEINGVAYPVTWTSTTSWTLRVSLNARESNFIIRALDANGSPLPGSVAVLTVNYTGTVEKPDGQVVINEIMYHPAIEGAEYVELYNTSTHGAFELSNYRLDGLDYVFPVGTWIEPGAYLVLARDRSAFGSAYGSSVPVFGIYTGHLDNKGETLRLIRPGANSLADTVVDSVAYSSEFPWPQAANGQGGSLQLIDPAADHNSPVNWAAVAPADAGQTTWRRVTVTGAATATSADLLIYHSPYQAPRAFLDMAGTWIGSMDYSGFQNSLSLAFYKTNNTWGAKYLYTGGSLELVVNEVSASHVNVAFPPEYGDVRWEGVLTPDGNVIHGTLTQSYQVTNTYVAAFTISRTDDQGRVFGGSLYMDDVQLVAGTVAELGTNWVRGGGFDASLADHWNIASNHQASAIVATNVHSGAGCLRLVASSGGQDEQTAIWQRIDGLVPGQSYTLSFWYQPSTSGLDLTVRLGDSSIATVQRISPELAATPGVANAVWIDKNIRLPLALTEVLPENPAGIQDARGHHSPWVELRNSSAHTVSLAGCYLASQTTNLLQWGFPAGAAIQPGQYLIVWLDGAESETTDSEWHANFTATPASGLVVLSHALNGRVSVLDSLSYQGLASGQSFGTLPNGEKSAQAQPTPGVVNPEPPSAIHIVINEWMADNTHSLADPADGQYKDWFELRNLGNQAVDLAGCRFSDDLAAPNKYVIPAGYTIPAQGYLLVWADSDPALNSPAQAALHVDFKLAKDGDTIALFAADGSLMDTVAFGRQTADISQGLDDRSVWVYMDTPTPGSKNVIPSVSVADRFRITDVVMEKQGVPMIMWTSVPGQTYQVQCMDAFSASTWANLGDPIVAGDNYSTVYADHAAATNGQRFYRVVLVKP